MKTRARSGKTYFIECEKQLLNINPRTHGKDSTLSSEVGQTIPLWWFLQWNDLEIIPGSRYEKTDNSSNSTSAGPGLIP